MQPQALLDEHQVHDHIAAQHQEGSHHQPVIDTDAGGLAVPSEEAKEHEDGGEDGEGNRHISNIVPAVLGQILLGREVGQGLQIGALGVGSGRIVDRVHRRRGCGSGRTHGWPSSSPFSLWLPSLSSSVAPGVAWWSPQQRENSVKGDWTRGTAPL